VTKDKSIDGEMFRGTEVKERPHEIRWNKSIGRERILCGKNL